MSESKTESERVNKIVMELTNLHRGAMLLEPRGVYDCALVGHTDNPRDQWIRSPGVSVAVYDRVKCLDAIQGWLRCEPDEAEEWFDCNTSGAWVGQGTPTFV